jgi:hypothetical protein
VGCEVNLPVQQDVSFSDTVILRNIYIAPAGQSDAKAEAAQGAQLLEADRMESAS